MARLHPPKTAGRRRSVRWRAPIPLSSAVAGGHPRSRPETAPSAGHSTRPADRGGRSRFLRTWARDWRDRTVVVADDIGAGSQDEGRTRHHSSSLRGPHLCPSDTPPLPNRLRHPHPPTIRPPALDPRAITVTALVILTLYLYKGFWRENLITLTIPGRSRQILRHF